MPEIYSASEDAQCLRSTAESNVLNPRASGLGKHAERGEATDGTSIPHPGCECMFLTL